MRMKKGLCVALALVMIFAVAAGLVGCGEGSKDFDISYIESFPYKIPYYKDTSINVTSVDFYQTEIEDYGKIEYMPYIIIKVDETEKEGLSVNDLHWANEEIEVSYTCQMDSDSNDLLSAELNLITSGKASDGNSYYAFSFFDVYKEKEKYYENFSGSMVEVSICIRQKNSEETDDETVRHYYEYSKRDAAAQSANDMDPKIQQAIVDAMGRAATAYINQLRGK